MSDLKTKKNNSSIEAFIGSIDSQAKQEDAKVLLGIFKKVTGKKATMWGDRIIGFGEYHYKYASGREGDWPLTGFSTAKTKHSIYIMNGFKEYEDLLKKLGKHKHSVSCLYVNKLADIDLKVLEEIIKKSFADMKKAYQAK